MKKMLIALGLLAGTLAWVPQPVMAAECPEGQIKLGVSIGGERCTPADEGGPIFAYVYLIARFLSGAVGLVVVLMIIVSGIQYITSAGNPEAIKSAKTRLTNAIIGLILFILMAGILNYIIPEGLIR